MTCVHFGGHGEFQIDIRAVEKNTYTFVFTLSEVFSNSESVFLLGFLKDWQVEISKAKL